MDRYEVLPNSYNYAIVMRVTCCMWNNDNVPVISTCIIEATLFTSTAGNV